MHCTRCGNDLSENTSICPRCGTVTNARPGTTSTSYGHYPQQNYESPSSVYQQGYTTPAQPQAGYIPPSPQPPQGSPPPYGGYPYPPVNVTIINNPGPTIVSGKTDSALIAEILLSLIGVFGVGWLLAGETTTGIILLVCSFIVYWPVMIFGSVFTFGVGILCLGPMAVAAIIVNAILLNKVLNRRTARLYMAQNPPQVQQHPPMQMPPQY